MEFGNWTEYKSAGPAWLIFLPLLVYLCVLAANILVLATFRKMAKLTTQHFFMIGLAVVDLLTLISNSVTIVTLGRGSVTMTGGICHSLAVLDITVTGVTTWTQSSMCIDKCFSIVQPISHRRFAQSRFMKRTIFGIILLNFICPLGVASFCAGFDFIEVSFFEAMPTCLFNPFSRKLLIPWLFFAAPFVIEAITHVIILIKIYCMGTERSKVLKAMKTVALTLGLYYVCWLPFLVYVLLRSLNICSECWRWLEFIGHNCIFLNSCLSLIIYYNTIPPFARLFDLYILRRHTPRDEITERNVPMTVAVIGMRKRMQQNKVATLPESLP